MVTMQPPRLTMRSGMCILTDEQGQESRFPKYQYEPLSFRRKIRLLNAPAAGRQRPVSSQSRTYEMVEYELEDTELRSLDVSKSPYVAVSYSWGAPVADVGLVIMVQGQERVLPMTATAWEAIERTLPAIGMADKSLWIDQVCINQGDKHERKAQVELMGEIYRRCWHCMIWLGSADDSTGTAFTLLHRLHQSFDQYQPIPIIERQVPDLSHTQIRARLAKSIGSDRLPPTTDPGWVEIAKLLQRDWFTRIWTFQEATLCYTGDASFRCGNYNMPFKTFTRASMFLGDGWNPGGINFAGVDFSEGRSRLTAIASFRDHVARNDPTPLIWLLQNNLGRNCFDPRDRIYAFLGLRNEDGPTFPIEVDYEKSPEDLYTDVARRIIRSQRNLRICADSPERAQIGGLVGLPSWVPDWTMAPITSAFEKFNVNKPYFNACKAKHYVDDEKNARILRVEGRIVDQIVQLIDVEVPNDLSEEERRNVLTQQVFPILVSTLRSRDTGTNDARITHKIVNTITLDGYTRNMNQGESGLPPEAWSEVTCEYIMNSFLPGGKSTGGPTPGIDPAQWLHSLTRQAIQCVNRRFALLENNLLGLLPRLSKVGDLIVILHGSTLPFVLRRKENDRFELIGSCFVDGIMHCERTNWTIGEKFDIC